MLEGRSLLVALGMWVPTTPSFLLNIEAVRQYLSLNRAYFDFFFYPDYAKGVLFCWLSRFRLKTRLLYVNACAVPMLLIDMLRYDMCSMW